MLLFDGKHLSEKSTMAPHVSSHFLSILFSFSLSFRAERNDDIPAHLNTELKLTSAANSASAGPFLPSPPSRRPALSPSPAAAVMPAAFSPFLPLPPSRWPALFPSPAAPAPPLATSLPSAATSSLSPRRLECRNRTRQTGGGRWEKGEGRGATMRMARRQGTGGAMRQRRRRGDGRRGARCGVDSGVIEIPAVRRVLNVNGVVFGVVSRCGSRAAPRVARLSGPTATLAPRPRPRPPPPTLPPLSVLFSRPRRALLPPLLAAAAAAGGTRVGAALSLLHPPSLLSSPPHAAASTPLPRRWRNSCRRCSRPASHTAVPLPWHCATRCSSPLLSSPPLRSSPSPPSPSRAVATTGRLSPICSCARWREGE